MQIDAARTLRSLVPLTAPGAAVAPVIAGLDAANDSLRAVRPALVDAGVGEQLIGELDRIRGAAATLRNALAELVAKDGMSTFDAAFAADDPAWDQWFTTSAAIVESAQSVMVSTMSV